MPIYTYINEKEEKIEVVRRISEIDVLPTEEETAGKEGPWTRIMSGGIDMRRSNAWGWGKGYFNDQKPDKRIK